MRAAPPALEQATFDRLARRIYEASGIQLGERYRGLLEARVRSRMREIRLDSPEVYERRLRADPGGEEELDRLLDLLAIHESYFFREEPQLDLIARRLAPPILQHGKGEPVRIWSAGCSAGQEPYSVAMILEERGLWRDGAFDISGTDFSPSCLEQARRGIYTSAALRDTHAGRKARFFERSGAEWSLASSVRGRVRFRRLNLYRDRAPGVLGRFDVILCRNLLLYLDAEARERVVERLWARLRPGGWLLVGRTETLMNVSTMLEAHEIDGEIAYRRQAGEGR